MQKTCFVIMPIGTQTIGSHTLTRDDQRKKYDDLIKEAIEKARPGADILRADDAPTPGAITSDILMRIMHSDYVVADITFPNPNVFYELGLRHACRIGTVLIREKIADPNPVPFDVAHLRFIEYDNSPSGLKILSGELRRQFDWIDQNSDHPDNQFLELAKLTRYRFYQFDDRAAQSEKHEMTTSVVLHLLKNPTMLALMMNENTSQEEKNAAVLKEFAQNPEAAAPLIRMMVDTGIISFDSD